MATKNQPKCGPHTGLRRRFLPLSMGLLIMALLPAGTPAAPAQSKTEIPENQLPLPVVIHLLFGEFFHVY